MYVDYVHYVDYGTEQKRLRLVIARRRKGRKSFEILSLHPNRISVYNKKKPIPPKGEFKLSDLYYPSAQDMPKERLELVMAYLTTGNLKQAAKITGLDYAKVRKWKETANWWNGAVQECQTRLQEELDAALTGIIHKATAEIEDRIVNGDHVYSAKNDKIIRVPVPAKSLAVTMAVVFDKRQLLRGEATSRVEKVSEEEKLNRLQKQFEQMARQIQAKDITDKVEVSSLQEEELRDEAELQDEEESNDEI